HTATKRLDRRHEESMSLLVSDAYAQTAGSALGGGGVGQIIILVAFVGVFYFLLIRPQQKRMKDQQAMLSRLAVGDEVVTSGGILGRIAEGVRIKVQKAQITQLMPKGTLKSA